MEKYDTFEMNNLKNYYYFG